MVRRSSIDAPWTTATTRAQAWPASRTVIASQLAIGHVAIAAGLGVAPASSKISGIADVNHDGTMDVLFQDTSTGAVHVGYMTSGHVSAQATVDWLLTMRRLD
jgi:hypothetical protein